MRRFSLIVALVVTLGTAACGGSGSDERVVLVDYSSDEYASAAFFNYPAKLDATPGQTILFKQEWTGEPHTVTGGAVVNDAIVKGKDWVEFFESFDALASEGGAELPNPEDPGAATVADFANALKTASDKAGAKKVIDSYNNVRASGVALPDLDNPPAAAFAELVTQIEEESDKAFSGLPFAFDDSDAVAQNVGQPCYKRTGTFPEEPSKPCTKAQQNQPAFDGKQAVYNSGLIRYEGPEGNTFEMKLADDIKPGTYFFYCAVHGLGQTTELEVKPKGTEVESRVSVARRARDEAEKTLLPLDKVYREALRSNTVTIEGEKIEGPFAGLVAAGADHALLNEFLPRKVTTKVNEPITWKAFGSDHTISFDVPKYFPILEFDTKDGVRLNPRLGRPAGGAPDIPEQDGFGVLKIDGGTYDGSGFWSSGLFGAEPYAEYTVRISKPGTYPYACLIHPPMIGQIVVEE